MNDIIVILIKNLLSDYSALTKEIESSYRTPIV